MLQTFPFGHDARDAPPPHIPAALHIVKVVRVLMTHMLFVQLVPTGYEAQPLPVALHTPLVPHEFAPMSVQPVSQQMPPAQCPLAQSLFLPQPPPLATLQVPAWTPSHTYPAMQFALDVPQLFRHAFVPIPQM
jgi:hypothetical protein